MDGNISSWDQVQDKGKNQDRVDFSIQRKGDMKESNVVKKQSLFAKHTKKAFAFWLGVVPI